MAGVSTRWEQIEDEHAAILDALNRVRVIALRCHSSARVLIPEFLGLVRKFEEHFANEERVMAETGFPDTAAHHRHHQVLLIRLLSICEHMNPDATVDSDELRLTFQSLLDDAIGVDIPLKEHLERQGAAASRP